MISELSKAYETLPVVCVRRRSEVQNIAPLHGLNGWASRPAASLAAWFFVETPLTLTLVLTFQHYLMAVRYPLKKQLSDRELLAEIEAQRSLMIAVATGGPRIQEVNDSYLARRQQIAFELQQRGISDPNPHADLWAWYGRWSAGDMPTYQSRRNHLAGLYQPLLDRISKGDSTTNARLFEEPTGWPRVDRGIYEIRRRLEQAETEEHFQAVGLLCREVLISAAQVVYDPFLHQSDDGVSTSDTDAKRMLHGYSAVELPGGSNEGLRRHAKAALSLANDLRHDRTADYRGAALCAEATTSVVNIIAIISGRRDRAGL